MNMYLWIAIILSIFIPVIVYFINKRRVILRLNSFWTPLSRVQKIKLWIRVKLTGNKPIAVKVFKRNFEVRFKRMIVRKINESIIENLDFNSEFKSELRLNFDDCYRDMGLPMVIWGKLKPLSATIIGDIIVDYKKSGYMVNFSLNESGVNLSFRDIS